MKIQSLSLIIIAFVTQQIFAQNKPTQKTNDSIQQLKEVVVSAHQMFGSKFRAKNRTGSAYYMDSEELQKFNITDINRALRTVPGVAIYEEDGMGLRPNISLRGTSPERSAKITVMEDGVLIAPAPYSAAAAYYFPTIARMQAVEIVKGSSQIQFGPYTTGGAINLVSTEIPTDEKTELVAQYGAFNSGLLRAVHGKRVGDFGYLVEYTKYGSDGFKTLENGGNTGFDKQDFVGKIDYNTRLFGIDQSLAVKYQYSDETSYETYVGITDADFKDDAFQRYTGSEKDQMNTLHRQYMLTHTLKFSPYLSFTTTAYQNEFQRNWYKLDYFQTAQGRSSLANILTNPDDYAAELNIIKGNQDSEGAALFVKANNRAYISKGIQSKLDIHWSGVNTFHDLEIGTRWHFDQEDRFQWVDNYAMNGGAMQLIKRGVPGTDANRVSDANAFAAYALYKFSYKNLTLTPGIRYEDMELSRNDFGKTDVLREGTNLNERSNARSVWIPGVGFQYNIDQVSIFGGIHKGFAPPGSVAGQKAEESINKELGARFSYAGLAGEIIAYRNDYSNLLGSDFAATGGTGNLDLFNAGAVLVQGLEFLVNYDLLQSKDKVSLPLTFGYTLTDTSFKNSFDASEGLWGDVSIGDEMPYIAKHQWHMSMGYTKGKLSLNTQVRHMSAIRTVAGQGPMIAENMVGANTIVDASIHYQYNSKLRLQTNIINLFNSTYEVSRVPFGLRPGHPLGINIGLRYSL
jgi:Fe(3+) dicitrate transport protein